MLPSTFGPILRAAAILMLCGAVAPLQAQQVWRCVAADGRVAFQQAPCAGAGVDAAAVDATPRNIVEGAPAGDARARVEARRSLELSDAMARGQVLPGMSLRQAQHLLGEPVRASRAVDPSGASLQRLTYRHANGTRTVYVDGDLITQVDWVDAKPSSRAGAATVAACPSAQDIRNMETSASAVTATDEQRKQWQKRADDARACRARD